MIIDENETVIPFPKLMKHKTNGAVVLANSETEGTMLSDIAPGTGGVISGLDLSNYDIFIGVISLQNDL